MSKENKVPLNLYGIMDNELARMHDLMRIYLALPKEDAISSRNYHPPGINMSASASMGELYRRILTLQDVLLQSLISHDKELQNRIAELALTGVKDET